MLSEEYLDKLSENLIKIFSELEVEYIDIISKKISKKKVSGYIANNIENEFILGICIQEFNKALNTALKKANIEINSIYDEIAKESYSSAETIAKYNNMPYIPYKENKQIQTLVESLKRITKNEFKNFSKTTALGTALDLGNGNIVFKNTRQMYYDIIDKAIVAGSTGLDSSNNLLRKSLKSLGNNGLQYVYYDNENKQPYRRNIVSSARMNIQDGMREVAQETQNKLGEQYGADGKELSVHGNCASDHIHIQGRQFTNDEYDKMNDNLKRRIGTCNCRHYAFSIVLGISIPTYDKKQLKALNDKNLKGWTDTNNVISKDGKHYTLYEASQELRKLENKNRKLRLQARALKNSGDELGAKDLNKQARAYRKKHKQLTESLEPYGVRPDPDRFII